MGTLLATVVLAVPLATWLNGTVLIHGTQLRLARIPPAPARDPSQFLEFQNSCNPHVAGVDEVSR
jgi:hypothetical protein